MTLAPRNDTVSQGIPITCQELCLEFADIGNPWLSLAEIVESFGLQGRSGNVARIISGNKHLFAEKREAGQPPRFRLIHPEQFK